MAEKNKKSSAGGGGNTELINYRFYENQKRQALTTTVEQGEDDDGSNDELLSLSSVPTAICDTVDALGNPPSSSVEAAEDASSSSSLAISAPSDKSRKGSVDQKIWNLVNLINRGKDSFFTTSSCSGRIILYTWDVTKYEKAEVEKSSVTTPKLKKGCKWLLVSHDEVQPEELVNAYFGSAAEKCESTLTSTGEGDVYFKMEPCILHVQCRTLSNARKLIHVATESGFRNSGMVIGKDNRITVAIRSAMGLEVPLPLPVSKRQENDYLGKCSPRVSEEYLRYLVETANEKMRENWARSEKLTKLFAETSWNA